jgi:hypothetical protein
MFARGIHSSGLERSDTAAGQTAARPTRAPSRTHQEQKDVCKKYPLQRFGAERQNIWRRGSESNRRIKVLQTSPLPLGYRALFEPCVFSPLRA